MPIPSSVVRYLGIYIDSDLSMQTHIQRSVAGCFVVLRQLRSIRRDVPSSVYISRWLLPLYYHGLITATRHWLASRPTCLTDSSLSSTRQLGRWLVFVARSILQMLSPVFTGCQGTQAHQVQTGDHYLPSSSRHCTSVLVGPAAVRWSTDETSRPAATCDRRPPVSSMSARRGLSLLAMLFCYCWPTTLEQSTCWCPVCSITHNISPEAENTFISAVIVSYPDIVLVASP